MFGNYKERYKKFVRQEIIKNFFGYAFVGGISNVLEIGYLFLFKEFFGIWYLIASAAAFAIGSFQTFFGRKFFVFKDSNLKTIPRQITLYGIVFGIGILINLVLMYIFVEVLHIYYAIAYIISVIFTGAVGFLWNKFVTFKK